MSAVLVEAVKVINLLNEKGLRYKAGQKEGEMVFQFGLAVVDFAKGKISKEVIEIIPKANDIIIVVMGKEKSVDLKGLEVFIDNVMKLKALQEEENKLISELSA